MIDVGHNAPATLRSAVCIVGSGPAGMTVALELERRGIDCVLLESGGPTADSEHAALNETPQIGIRTDPTSANRVRALGGTSALWGGMCRPLDAIDFEARPWVPDSGWPIFLRDLLPFYETAHEILGLPKPSYDVARVDPSHGSAVPLAGPDFENVAFFWDSSPMRFGSHYEPRLRASGKIRVFLDSTVVNLETGREGQHVIAAEFTTLGGASKRVEARHFVIATGALHTARLLLNSNDVHRSGLGNERDLVGRYFMQHPVWRAPYLLTFDPRVYSRVRRTNGKGNSIASAIRAESARSHHLLNFHFLAKRPKPPPGIREGRSLLRYWRNRIGELNEAPSQDRIVEEFLLQLRAAEETGGEAQPLRVELEMRPEQAPNRESRIRLGEERDAVGMRRAVMDWRLTSLDRESLRAGMRLLARSMAVQEIGRVNIGPDELRLPEPGGELLHGGHHHYGTTRMSDSPMRGVVDRDCRMHTVRNVYVAGSAVFPTTGYVNPTLSIVAIAARVASHIAGIASPPAGTVR